MSKQNKSLVRLAVFGGTFNPPHLGHLSAVLALKPYCDKLLVTVAGDPWQKTGPPASREPGLPSVQSVPFKPAFPLASAFPLAPAQLRFHMAQAAFSHLLWCEVSDMEIERKGETHTADTLEQLSDTHPDSRLILVLGSDIATELDTWKRTSSIRNLAELAVLERPGHDSVQLPASWRKVKTTRIKADLPDISSSKIRQLVATGTPVEDLAGELLAPKVAQLIKQYELYSGSV